MLFGDKLKILRERKNLAQTELARLCGLPASSISHFEHGRRKPSFDSIIKLCEALTCSSDLLLGLIEDDAKMELSDLKFKLRAIRQLTD